MGKKDTVLNPIYLFLWNLYVCECKSVVCCYKLTDQSVFYFQVAIKSIRKEKIKDDQDMVHIRREIEIMSSLRHPHIISIYEGDHFLHVWKYIHTHTYTQQIIHTCLPWTHINKNTRLKSTPPSALVAKLQDCHVMTCRCHNKTWTTALGCYSSSLLCLDAWASKSLDGFNGVPLDLSECVCARVLWMFVCKRGGILL